MADDQDQERHENYHDRRDGNDRPRRREVPPARSGGNSEKEKTIDIGGGKRAINEPYWRRKYDYQRASGEESDNGANNGDHRERSAGTRRRGRRREFSRNDGYGNGRAGSGSEFTRDGDPPAVNQEGVRELKVSAVSNPKAVAGSIAKSVREGILPVVRAVGDASVNQSVKAFAIARSYLEEDNIDVCFQPELRESSQFNFEVHLHTYEAHRRTEAQKASVAKVQQEMKVAAGSTTPNVAGAIANRARAGERICVMAIGPTSVANAIKAIALARRYLCHDSLELFCKPEFSVVEVENGEQRSSLCIGMLVVQT